jgi:predicted glycosyltransferase
MSRLQSETLPYDREVLTSGSQERESRFEKQIAVSSKRVWIDLDNSPHVPFFAPIIRELERRGHSVVVTARDFAQVTQLAELMHLRYTTVGRHYGKNKLFKIAGVVVRAAQLARICRRARPALAVSHGSRAQLLLSALLKIPSIDISDYEYATDFRIIRPSWMITPDTIPTCRWPLPEERVLHYPGIKEDVYVPEFVPDPTLLTHLNVSDRSILVTLRPPASHAHYHNPESDTIFKEVMNWLVEEPNVVTVLLPRTPAQKEEIRQQWGAHFASGKLMIPAQAVDGLNLIWHSDLVISGGGTMNREAAALRVPVYSIFRGKIGAVDQYLVRENRLILIESASDVRTRIKLAKRDRLIDKYGNTATLNAIVNHITSLLDSDASK